jgi:iron complex transport system substrate-binding protein
MRRPRPPVTLAPLLCALACASGGCAPGDGTTDREREAAESLRVDSIVVVDAAGARVALARPASRIVSLVPSATQTLDALGARDALVGRTDFDTEGWLRDVPSVGGGLEPSLESIVALEPDLVIRFGGEQDPRTAERLTALGIPFLTIRPDRVADILQIARTLGRVTGRAEAGEALAREIAVGLERTRAAVADWPRKRVAYVLGGTPPWVSGPNTYIDEVLAMVGGDNVFSDLDRLYASVSPEELRTREIDVVLVSEAASFDASLAPEARVVTIGSALEIPGPGVVTEARRVAELLHDRRLD